ncbi:DinB family protein [uncultured Eudoraea sp.]|uniref:DinB family protein n=1 Tax=uncultured Eudoraea sp. TaxID=1035614 RepID=UPI002604CF2E|nr:DinB family protein [uncultured Eudoraea sp.]
MKKILLPIIAILLLSFSLSSSKLTDQERVKGALELTKTQAHMLESLNGLSEEQLNFKSSPESWSIAECVEHLAISENAFDQMLQESLKTPADPSKRADVKMTDKELMAMIRNRDTKIKTSEPFEPSGKFGSYEESLKTFQSKRVEHIVYMETTEDDLRNHYAQLPFGTVDAFQILMFMSGHTERHVKQMEEVKADNNFPKE